MDIICISFVKAIIKGSFCLLFQKPNYESYALLQNVSKENCKTMPQWEQLHRDIIADTENGEVILLEGSHYLHFEQKKAIVERTTQWIGSR